LRGVGAGEDSVGFDVVEGEVDRGSGRLGRVAVAGRVGVEDPADLGLAVLEAAEEDGDVAEEQTVLEALHLQDDPVVVALQPGRRDPPRQRLGDLLPGAWLPVEVPRHLGQRLGG
jgi:hypothetical protein